VSFDILGKDSPSCLERRTMIVITGTTASRQTSVTERPSRSRLKGKELDMLTYIKAYAAEFTPAEVLILVGAFNKAWQSILDSGTQLDEKNAESTREILATRIIETAKRGELNQRRLSEDALAHLTAMNSRRRSTDLKR
jgi:hypothetical protein